jgi:hypothetical protein
MPEVLRNEHVFRTQILLIRQIECCYDQKIFYYQMEERFHYLLAFVVQENRELCNSVLKMIHPVSPGIFINLRFRRMTLRSPYAAVPQEY